MSNGSNNDEQLNKSLVERDGINSNVSLEKLIELDESGEDLSNLVDQRTINNIRSFLVLYVKNQFRRILKLTNFVEKMEDAIISSLDDPNSHKMDDVMKTMKTLQLSLDKALGLVQKICSNDDYLQVVVGKAENINYIYQQGEENVVNLDKLVDQDSREKIRGVIMDILDDLNADTSESNEEYIIDVDSEGYVEDE